MGMDPLAEPSEHPPGSSSRLGLQNITHRLSIFKEFRQDVSFRIFMIK